MKHFTDRHQCYIAAKFDVFVDEDHDKCPVLCWLAYLYKMPYKSRFIANSRSSTTTTELPVPSCLIAIKTPDYIY